MVRSGKVAPSINQRWKNLLPTVKEKRFLCPKKSEVIFVLKPLLLSMKILGLWPKDSETFRGKFNILSYITYIYLHGYGIHSMVNWLFTFHRDMGFFVFLTNASLVIRTMATAATFNLFFLNNQCTLSSLINIGDFPPLFHKFGLRSLRTYVTCLALGSWLYLVIQMSFSAWSVATMETQKFMDFYFYGFEVGHVNEGLMRFLMASVWITYTMITLSTEIFLKSFYVAACLLLGGCARAYNAMVADVDAKEKVSGKDINEINRLHTKLCDLVVEVDSNFTMVVFIWISTIFLNICTNIGAIVVGNDASEISSAVTDVLNYLVIFIVIGMTGADVSYQCELGLPIAHRLASKADMSDLTVLYQVKLMIAKMSCGVAKLTGWNCFVIDRPFILTVIGTILTYSVVLTQMSRSVGPRKGFSNHSISQEVNFTASWIENITESFFDNITTLSAL